MTNFFEIDENIILSIDYDRGNLQNQKLLANYSSRYKIHISC
jgi:hypothetical protein